MKGEDWHLYQLRWGLGQTLALIALAAAFGTGAGAPLVFLGAILLIAAMTIRPPWIGRFQPLLVRFGPRLLLLVILLDLALSVRDLLPAILRALCLLLLYRALEFRLPRQDRQLLLLALFLLLLSGVLTESLGFAVALFVFVPLAMTLLAVIVIEEDRKTVVQSWKEVWIRFSWRRWSAEMSRRFDHRVLLLMTMLYLGFVVASLMVFWALPRFEIGRQLPFAQLSSTSSLTGFTETVNFGSIVDIQKDNGVAMRVDAPAEAARSAPYWRMMVLDEYFGRGFRQSESARQAVTRVSDHLIRMGAAAEAEATPWVHYLEGGISRQIPFVGSFSELQFSSRQNIQINRSVSTAGLERTPAGLLVFQVSGVEQAGVIPAQRADRALWRNARSGRTGEERGNGYPWTTLGLPDDARTREFLGLAVEEIAAKAGDGADVEAFARAATEWLQAGRIYSLQTVIAEEGDPLVNWMESREGGHCELFAGSLILLAREAGIPARLVTGFHGGSWNGFENYFMVRHAHAHAWVELYSPEEGWVRHDPTPSAGGPLTEADGGLLGLSVERGLGAYLDSLRVTWYRRIVRFDQRDQQAILGRIRAARANLGESGSRWLRKGSAWVADRFSGLQRVSSPMPVLASLAMLLLALGSGSVAKRLRWRFVGREGRERKIRRLAERRLRRLGNSGIQTLPEEWLLELRRLRYGDVTTWRDPIATLQMLDRELRRKGCGRRKEALGREERARVAR